MKEVYIFYLILPDNYSSMASSDVIDDFNSVKVHCSQLTTKYNDETDSWYYLYAFTTDKKKAKKFKKTHRKDIFILQVKKIAKKDYKEFKKANRYAKLVYHTTEYDTAENNITLLCTYGESVTIDNDFILCLNGDMAECCEFDFRNFTKPIQKALDQLGYCDMFVVAHGDDETVDYYSYNLSYGVSATGGNSVKILPNILNMYIKYYRFLLDPEYY